MKILCDRCKREYDGEEDRQPELIEQDARGYVLRVKENICPDCQSDTGIG